MDTFEGFPHILAIFFCEFHPIQGPKVVYEVPENFVTSSCPTPHAVSPRPTRPGLLNPTAEPGLDFDSISDYIIPKPELCNRLVTISTPFYKIMGYPVSIEDPKYERNALLFNLCFVFEKNANTGSYEQVVRKMARVMRSLEVEGEFLHNANTKGGVLNIMEQLLEDLNSYAECQIPINDANMINLKLFPQYPEPPPVYDHQVPVFIVDLAKFVDKYWDMTIRRIIPHIDGVRPVKHVAEASDVQLPLVRSGIQHLLYYGCVKLVDIFQFRNIYSIRPSIQQLLSMPDIQSECAEFVKLPKALSPPPFSIVYSLYCSLKHNQTVSEWMKQNHVNDMHIDPRRFILYGVIKGFVYRVHKYPVWLSSPGTSAPDSSNRFLRKLLDGRRHYDELCIMLGCSTRELDELLKVEPAIKYIWK